MRDRGSGTPEDLAKRVGWFRSKLFWTGVSYARYWKFRKVLAVLLTVHVVVGVLALDLLANVPPLPAMARLLPGDWVGKEAILVVVWATSLAASIAWGKDWQVPFFGLLVGPLILPVLLVTFVAQVLMGAPDQLLHMVRPNEQPPGNFGPTATLVQSRANDGGRGRVHPD